MTGNPLNFRQTLILGALSTNQQNAAYLKPEGEGYSPSGAVPINLVIEDLDGNGSSVTIVASSTILDPVASPQAEVTTPVDMTPFEDSFTVNSQTVTVGAGGVARATFNFTPSTNTYLRISVTSGDAKITMDGSIGFSRIF